MFVAPGFYFLSHEMPRRAVASPCTSLPDDPQCAKPWGLSAQKIGLRVETSAPPFPSCVRCWGNCLTSLGALLLASCRSLRSKSSRSPFPQARVTGSHLSGLEVTAAAPRIQPESLVTTGEAMGSVSGSPDELRRNCAPVVTPT